jgi:hypothetical protein
MNYGSAPYFFVQDIKTNYLPRQLHKDVNLRDLASIYLMVPDIVFEIWTLRLFAPKTDPDRVFVFDSILAEGSMQAAS